MYPFGSGMPNYPNSSPYPSSNQIPYPPNQTQAPYQISNHAPTIQSSYPPTNESSYPPNIPSPYPPQNNQAYSSTTQTATAPSGLTNQISPAIYNSTNQSPYHQSINPAPYPSSNILPAAYPPTSQTSYPSGNNRSATGCSNFPYPQTNQTPYPTFGAGLPNTGYPSDFPMFGFGGGISGSVSQSQSVYPFQSHSNQSQFRLNTPSSTYGSQNPSTYPTQSGNHNGIPTGPKPCSNMYPDIKAVNFRNSYSQTPMKKEKGTPIIIPAQNFDPMADASALRKAMKGFGTDEDALINIVCHRSNEQRQVIQQYYKTNFGKDLIEDIKSETSGNFEKLLVALLTPTLDFYIKELHDAMVGIGTDEDVLIEVLCSLSNHEIHTIKQAYHHKYRTHLDKDLMSETSGHFKRLLVSLCVGGRDENTSVDQSLAQKDATDLLRAGELMVGTDESTFNLILCRRSFPHLKMVCEEYQRISGHSLEKAIKKEFSGDIMDGLTAIIQCVSNKHEFFASRLHKSMAGFGTNDNQLIRVIVTRSEIDLQDVKLAFERKYGKSLKSWIKGDTSGHYKHCLYELIGEQRSS